jgi:beta-galactosidase/beta-glucuronidase
MVRLLAHNKLNLFCCCALLLQAERLSWHPSILTWCSGHNVLAHSKQNCCFCGLLLLQAERLSWHPSILTWCGNNELELSYEWANNTFIRSNRNMFVNDYMTNIRTLRRAIKKVRHER